VVTTTHSSFLSDSKFIHQKIYHTEMSLLTTVPFLVQVEQLESF